MKDLDKLLSQPMPKPKRPLSNNFTKEIIMKVKRPRQTGWQRLRGNLRGVVFTKAGAASLAGVVLISGTVAAVSLWPRPTVTPTVTKKLPSGNHIVGYDTQNCKYFDALDGSKIEPKTEKVYYEVRENSQLTDQQIQDSLRANCEENISNNAVSSLIRQYSGDGLMSTMTLTVKAINKNSITVQTDAHYAAANNKPWPEYTYSKLDGKLLVRDQDTAISYADLKIGDTVKMIVRDSSGKSTETPGGYDPLSHPENITILAILRIPALTGDPTTLQRAFAQDIVRLEACADSPTGLCRTYEFSQQ